MYTLHMNGQLVAMESVEALLDLRHQIDALLDSFLPTLAATSMAKDEIQVEPVDDVIDTVTARQLAKDRGIEIPSTTIVDACTTGRIIGAYKPEGRGRWLMSRAAFEKWISTYRRR